MDNFAVEGLKEFEETLGEFKKGTARGVMRRALIASAAPMVAAAKQKAPKDKGDLAESYTVSTKAKGQDAFKGAFSQAMSGGASRSDARAAGIGAQAAAGVGLSFAEVYVGSTSRKAHLQEFGTVNHVAQPHFRPAVDQTTGAVVDLISGELEKQISKTQVRLARKAAKSGA